MKIIAENQAEFDQLCETFRYLHDFCVIHTRFNWKFWQWMYMDSEGKLVFDWTTGWAECLDLENNDMLNRIVHLYRIKHAHLEGPSGIEESEELKKIFFIGE